MLGMGFYFAKLMEKTNIATIKNSQVNQLAKVGSFSRVTDSVIGKYSYLGNHCICSNAHIGNFTSISSDVTIGGGEHPADWVSTSPAFYGKSILGINLGGLKYITHKTTTIGNDVWIGNRVCIKSGVNIADGAVIGMGSIVTKDIGPYEIWAGNPARMIRKRFDDQTIDRLATLNWWNWDDQKIAQYAEKFDSVEAFLRGIE
jgi:acetyltransferase-like isoleucine patch superfamily enzyme